MTHRHTITVRGTRRPLAPLLKGAHPTVTLSILAWRLWHKWPLWRARETPYHRRGARVRYGSFPEAVTAYLTQEGSRP